MFRSPLNFENRQRKNAVKVQFKKHFYNDIDEWELYDRLKDPNEMKNVYNNPEYKKIIEKLTEDLKQMRIKYGDSDLLDKSFIY